MISHVHDRNHNLYVDNHNLPPFHSPILDLRSLFISKGLQLLRVQFFLQVIFGGSIDLAIRGIPSVKHTDFPRESSQDFRP
jgi:hypothetical protein